MANPVLRSRVLLPCLLLALPLAAAADPVTVTTRTTGVAGIDTQVLAALGIHVPTVPGELPYELTIRSTFDPVATLPGPGEGAGDGNSAVEIDFRIAGMQYHYAGTGRSWASLNSPDYSGGDAYFHSVLLPDFRFEHTAFAPLRSFGPGGALDEREVHTISDGIFAISTYPTIPDAPGMWVMGGTISTYSLQVTSAVPEPASYALYAVGLLAFGWRRRTVQAEGIKELTTGTV